MPPWSDWRISHGLLPSRGLSSWSTLQGPYGLLKYSTMHIDRIRTFICISLRTLGWQEVTNKLANRTIPKGRLIHWLLQGEKQESPVPLLRSLQGCSSDALLVTQAIAITMDLLNAPDSRLRTLHLLKLRTKLEVAFTASWLAIRASLCTLVWSLDNVGSLDDWSSAANLWAQQ